MLVHLFYWPLLATFVCVCCANQNEISNFDLAEKSEIEDIAQVFHLSGSCVSDADCHHLGECVTKNGGKSCECKDGTSGELCEKVDECVDNPVKCGTLDDVSCIYDVELEKAVCKCDNESKTYVEDEERCMSPCSYDKGCGKNGVCYHEIGDKMFCACYLGASGDYCEIVDACQNKRVDCGVDNNATCLLGGKGNAYCKCDDITLGFDYDAKVCKDCSGCGERAYRIGGCTYKNGKRSCICKSRSYSSENGICEDCKCGENSYGCKFQNETKICLCFGGSAHNNGLCQECNCGSSTKVSTCEFIDGKKVCTCKDGYFASRRDGSCIQMCNATSPCQNGGTCSQHICSCLSGTSGDLCQTVDACKSSSKCGMADCRYNVSAQQAYCHCDSPLKFDDYYKRCRTCECGSHMKSCAYQEGEKVCTCNGKVYADKLGTCTLCYCKGYSSMYGCKFDKRGNIICPCLKGFSQVNDECKECNCGDHGNCTLFGWTKSCKCDEGYVAKDGMCEDIVINSNSIPQACDCGENGWCSLDNNGKKSCYCNEGYKEYRGTCKECKCGKNSECSFHDIGFTLCTCKSGYGSRHGACTKCNCDPGTSCTFHEDWQKTTKECICPDKYANNDGSCQPCDCEVKGSKCTFTYGYMHCECPKGYKAESPPYTFFKKYCKDIDECKDSYACPSGTKCINTPGSYDCECKDGYEKPKSIWKYDIKKDGCVDIDECIREYLPCIDSDARCVNTPGSYRCECRSGYTLRKSYLNEKNNECYIETRPWRTASAVIGSIAGVICIGLMIGICKRFS